MRTGYLLVFVFLLSGCAIQVPPQGGEKDVDPPKLISALPADGSTGFNSSEIEFVFDENIQVKELSNKLVVSPPFPSLPLAKVRKNRLIVSLSDTLSPNTTYCFNFGDAVADLNEGNPIKDFKYVVSTGSLIDSLSVSGKVVRSEDLKSDKSMLAMLYPATADDSAPYKMLPSYFARCTDKGYFRIENVAAGSYKLFALSDANQDYRYSDPSERIAFPASTVMASDSALLLRSFIKRPSPAVIKASADGPGKINVIFNVPQPVAQVRWKYLEQNLGVKVVSTSKWQDTVSIWFSRLDVDTAQLLVDFKSRTDTFDLTLKTYDPSRVNKSSFLLAVRPETEGGYLSPGRMLTMRTSHPIERTDLSRITMTEEGVDVKITLLTASDSSKRMFVLDAPLSEEKRYSLKALPGAFTDIYGRTNDTIEESVQVRSVTDYGTLRLNIDLPTTGDDYLLQLVDEKENVFREAGLSKDAVLFFELLSPGTYRLKLIADSNRNGRWDAGDDLARMQPEEVMYHRDQVPIRANWDVEVKWVIQR